MSAVPVGLMKRGPRCSWWCPARRGLQRGEVGNIRVVEAEDAAGAAGEEEIAARRQAGGVHALPP